MFIYIYIHLSVVVAAVWAAGNGKVEVGKCLHLDQIRQEHLLRGFRVWGSESQGHLTYKKTHPPRTLPKAYA